MTLALLDMYGGRMLKLGVLAPLTTAILKLVICSRSIVLFIMALARSSSARAIIIVPCPVTVLLR